VNLYSAYRLGKSL